MRTAVRISKAQLSRANTAQSVAVLTVCGTAALRHCGTAVLLPQHSGKGRQQTHKAKRAGEIEIDRSIGAPLIDGSVSGQYH